MTYESIFILIQDHHSKQCNTNDQLKAYPPHPPFSRIKYSLKQPKLLYYYRYYQTMMIQFEPTQEDLSIELSNFQYKQPIGRFKPKFINIPQDYYPLTNSQALAYASIVILTIGFALSIMIGFLFWITKAGLESFVQIWSILFLLFVLVMIIGFYVGGSTRIREEKRMIIKSQQAYQKLKDKKQDMKQR